MVAERTKEEKDLRFPLTSTLQLFWFDCLDPFVL